MEYRLGEEASQVQLLSGELLLNLLQVTLEIAGITMDTSKICIYNILTYNCFNTAHKDNDGMHVRNSEEIVDYIMKSKLPQLIKWLESFWKAFGRKETLPMPTN